MTNHYKLIYPLNIPEHEKHVKHKENDDVILEKVQEASKTDIQSTSEIMEKKVEARKRPVLPFCNNDSVLTEVELIKQYLHDTGVSITMKKLTVSLLQGQIVPYNPYSHFIRHFRRLAEKFHLNQKSLSNIKQDVSQSETFQATSGVLAGSKLSDSNIWGVKHNLSAVNPKILKQITSLISTICVPDTLITEKCGKDVSVLVSLTGPFIFTGSVFPNIFQIDFNETVVVVQKTNDETFKLFSLAILEDLRFIIFKSSHFLINFSFIYNKDNLENSMEWTAKNLKDVFDNSALKTEFAEKVAFGIKNHAIIKATFAAKVNLFVSETSEKVEYLPVQKFYNLMCENLADFSSIGNTQIKLGGISLTNIAYQDIHEGIYFERNKAEYYLTYLKKNTSAKTPMYAPVASNIKQLWKNKIASNFAEDKVIESLNYLYLLDKILNVSKTSNMLTENDLAVQIARVSHGSAVKLLSVEPLSKILKLLLKDVTNDIDSAGKLGHVIENIFKTYSYYMFNVFFLHEYSFDIECVKDVIAKKLSFLKENISSTDNVEKCVDTLTFLMEYTKVIALILFDDALESNNVINTMRYKINTELNIEPPNPQKLGVTENSKTFTHALKNTFYLNVDKLQLDLSQCAISGSAPKNIAHETAMMQYCVDMHIDEIWKEYLQILLFDRDHLPPNPHPQLVSLLQKGSLKVQLFRESDLNIAKRLVQNKIKLFDTNLKLYTISSLHAFGPLFAIKILNLNGYRHIQGFSENLSISKFNLQDEAESQTQLKKFDILCIPAISSETLFYGASTPYLAYVIINEHCIIRGPSKSEHSGVTTLAQRVIASINALIAEGVLPAQALFGNTKIDISDFPNLETRVKDEFIVCISSSQCATITLLYKFDWRYIQVHKNFFVYYVNENNENVTSLTKPLEGLQNSQVFFTADNAVYYNKLLKSLPPIQHTKFLSTHLKHNWDNRDWATLSCLISTKALLNFEKEGKFSDVDYSLLAFTWRYFHSSAGSLYYCKSLMVSLTLALQHLNIGDSHKVVLPVIEKMIIGLKNKLYNVLKSSLSLMPKSLNVTVQQRLEKYCHVDVLHERVKIHDVHQFLNELKSMISFLDFIIDSTFYELVKISEPVLKISKEL